MQKNERITVTLPAEIVRNIDRRERNRSKFVREAVGHEIESRRQKELRRSLKSPHSESTEYVDEGFEEWSKSLPQEDLDLVDVESGTAVRWIPGKGWKATHK